MRSDPRVPRRGCRDEKHRGEPGADRGWRRDDTSSPGEWVNPARVGGGDRWPARILPPCHIQSGSGAVSPPGLRLRHRSGKDRQEPVPAPWGAPVKDPGAGARRPTRYVASIFGGCRRRYTSASLQCGYRGSPQKGLATSVGVGADQADRAGFRTAKCPTPMARDNTVLPDPLRPGDRTPPPPSSHAAIQRFLPRRVRGGIRVRHGPSAPGSTTRRPRPGRPPAPPPRPISSSQPGLEAAPAARGTGKDQPGTLPGLRPRGGAPGVPAGQPAAWQPQVMAAQEAAVFRRTATGHFPR